MAGSDDQHEGAYRQYLHDLSLPRFTTMQKQDATEYAEAFKHSGNPPWLHGLYLHWLKLFQEPFKGITNDGHIRPNLFNLRDEGIPITRIVTAANTLLSKLSPSQLSLLTYHIDSPEWRTWSNPELLLSPKREEALGLELMRSLPPDQQSHAQIYKQLHDPAMPPGRWNHDDQRHLCGAYRDNRVAVLVSPVVIVEFDHHSGVFLANEEPKRFHIHTLLRTPNGGDYGMALRKLIPGMEQEYLWEGEGKKE
ncbi:hypothetical protein N0V88_004558 [Collariella sp. IMI 366227]|nr:hypothetical protein N0V88_004558 [Collariella sp. IMI 366227]